MERQDLISKLLSTDNADRQSDLIRRHSGMIDVRFARDLKDTYYESWTTAPQKTLNAASALAVLAKLIPTDEVRALASWVTGIADLTNGRIERAVRDLDKAASIFLTIGHEHDAAQTQVAKLIALALLGKYDESVATGRHALKAFEKFDDELSAGKIEKNLGNIMARQAKESAAEKYYLKARRRFTKLNDQSELAMCNNSLANTYAELNDFHRAEMSYREALESAHRAKMHVTEAEIEASMGNLALFRGNFHEALRFLELSRQKYQELKMPHQTAIAELEIADIYLELNLSDEAFSIYEKVTESFKRLKLQGEEARARANFGKAALLVRDINRAKRELKKSARLYVLEKNPNGAANVKLTEAALELARGNYANALTIIREAERLVAKTENLRQKLLSRWLHGEILRNQGRSDSAERLLADALNEAIRSEQSNLAHACLNSLGDVAFQRGDRSKAKRHYQRAVKMIDTLRAPLAAEEFRMAFMYDKLGPVESLAKIYLGEGDLRRAFLMIEKAKARTLSENLTGNFVEQQSKTPPKLSRRLADLREELNWYYSRLSRAEAGAVSDLQKKVKDRESQIVDLMRQIASLRSSTPGVPATRGAGAGQDELRLLQNALGNNKALIEFIGLDGVISAFVVTDKRIDHIADLVRENDIHALLEGIRFQFATLRFGKQNLGPFMDELKKRVDHYFQALYDKLIRPLEAFVVDRDLVVVPAGPLHYLPFHALNDGESYVIERRAVVYAPSASVWRSLAKKQKAKNETALLMGYAAENIPLVNDEIAALHRIFPGATTFTGKGATFKHYKECAGNVDILHLACHGQFRPDNPMFSSLELADGFVTVGDICSQKLKAKVVTLSACETGLNKIYAGEEILGLARGFLTAGATSLVLSLWTVNDEATMLLMKEFYLNLQRGRSVAASLRNAQLEFIGRGEHPFFWSPFISIGS